MSSLDFSSKIERRKKIEDRMNSLSESRLMAVSLFIVLVLAFVVIVPVSIVALPFMLAWDTTKALLEVLKKKKAKEENPFLVDFNSLDNVTMDLKNWFNIGND